MRAQIIAALLEGICFASKTTYAFAFDPWIPLPRMFPEDTPPTIENSGSSLTAHTQQNDGINWNTHTTEYSAVIWEEEEEEEVEEEKGRGRGRRRRTLWMDREWLPGCVIKWKKGNCQTASTECYLSCKEKDTLENMHLSAPLTKDKCRKDKLDAKEIGYLQGMMGMNRANDTFLYIPFWTVLTLEAC